MFRIEIVQLASECRYFDFKNWDVLVYIVDKFDHCLVVFFLADAPYTAPPPAEASNSEIIGVFMIIPFVVLLVLMAIADTPVIYRAFMHLQFT